MALNFSHFIEIKCFTNFSHKRLQISTWALKKIVYFAGQCESVMCGLHQWCRLDDNGRPECYCHQACKEIEAPVCGRENSKQYINTCELKREECLTQKIIGMDLGRCRGNVSKVVLLKSPNQLWWLWLLQKTPSLSIFMSAISPPHPSSFLRLFILSIQKINMIASKWSWSSHVFRLLAVPLILITTRLMLQVPRWHISLLAFFY